MRVVVERHAPRRNHRTSSHHERSRQTGDWRRGGDPPPLAHLILSTTLLTASAPLPCSSQLPHVSSSQPRQPHSTFHPYPTLPFPLFPYLSRPLALCHTPLSLPRTPAPLPIPSSRLCLSLMPRPAMTRTVLTPQRSSSNASTLSPSPLVFLSGLYPRLSPAPTVP